MMWWKSTVVLLVVLLSVAAVLVKSESNIEVDENGDEYEVKRFNIQGRQLEGGRSQCVVTRRKRATSSPDNEAMSVSSADDADPEESGKQPNLQDFVTSQTTPATGVDTDTSVDKEDEDEHDLNGGVDNDDDMNGDDFIEGDDEDDDPLGNLQNANKQQVAVALGAGQEEEEIPQDESDYTDSGTTAATGTFSPSASVAALAHAGPDSTNGVVVVHGGGVAPPNVNGQTHAVFQIVPVGGEEHTNNDLGVYIGDGDGDDLHYEEEISPISTTAIWSTGDDQPLQYDTDKEPASGAKPAKRPGKGNKGNKRPKNKNRKGVKRRNRNKAKKGNKRRRGNKNRRPQINKRRRGNKNRNQNKNKNTNRKRNKNKKTKLVKRRRYQPKKRYPSSGGNRGSSANYDYNDNRDRRRNKKKSNVKSSNRRMNADVLNANRRQGNKKNRFKVDKGTNTFTKTETETATGTANDQRDVNCIFIRKDAPTTPRPFWNLLGRDAGAVGAHGAAAIPAASGHFGKRKRANVRFIAPKN